MKPRTRKLPLTLLVTIGLEGFDSLISRIFSDDVASLLKNHQFGRLIVQTGESKYDKQKVEELKKNFEMEFEVYDYKNSLLDDIDRADVVVGHAGAGTCLEVMRKNKRLLLVVNETPTDDHQIELSDQLEADNHVIKTRVDNLLPNLERICEAETKLEVIPPDNSSKAAFEL